MHGCETCGNKFKAKTLLKEHISVTNHLQKAHSVSCEICKDELSDQEELKKHIQHIHTFACETCEYTGIGEEAMEDHILEKHAKPDSNDVYKCDECNFQFKDKSGYGQHFKSNHGSNSKTDKNKPSEKETFLENELRQLKNNLKP